MKKLFYQACIELTNHRLLSRILRAFSRSKISRRLIPSFIKTYQLNEKEMGRPVSEYTHLHDLFIRTLKPGARPVDPDPKSVISPVDGAIAQAGQLEENTSFSVKGQMYTVAEMLGGQEEAARYRDGLYIILYLSPKDYHRIHSPVDGLVRKQWSLGGRSYPVNEAGLRYGRRPLSRNYRMITELQVADKHLAIVKVGAMNINTIEWTHRSTEIKKGDEIAYFSFGSTVVLLAEKGLLDPDSVADAGSIQMGARLAMKEESDR
ncbi:phosphatidylserine decarboxylase [Halalkalibacter oceani]|uniref:phosphatidylserine decarboxylase n=1 Tax=Halalkalibacter oceani TaxID=1653776 RepID=UPI00339682EB